MQLIFSVALAIGLLTVPGSGQQTDDCKQSIANSPECTTNIEANFNASVWETWDYIGLCSMASALNKCKNTLPEECTSQNAPEPTAGFLALVEKMSSIGSRECSRKSSRSDLDTFNRCANDNEAAFDECFNTEQFGEKVFILITDLKFLDLFPAFCEQLNESKGCAQQLAIDNCGEDVGSAWVRLSRLFTRTFECQPQDAR